MKVNKEFVKELNIDATIIAATKYLTKEECLDFLEVGITNFGENRTDSFLEKYEYLQGKNITWHLIGKLQSKKVKTVIDKIDYLHSLDRITLAEEIEKRSNKVIKCFIEVNSGEEQKDGVSYSEFDNFFNELKKYTKIEVVGLMTMAENTEDESSIRTCFTNLKNLADKYNLKYLSMGMSEDYKIAIECGATHVRLGRVLLK